MERTVQGRNALFLLRHAVFFALFLLISSVAYATQIDHILVPVKFLKQGTTGNYSEPQVGNIRQSYKTYFDNYFLENSYNRFTVKTYTQGYIHMQWPLNPLPGHNNYPDPRSMTAREDLADAYLTLSAGGGSWTGPSQNIKIPNMYEGREMFYEFNTVTGMPYDAGYGGGYALVDGWWTPGERFRDINQNGTYDYADPWVDIRWDGIKLAQDTDWVWDDQGERFLDLNGNGRYDRSVIIDIYSSVVDDLDGNRDGINSNDGNRVANCSYVVDEFWPAGGILLSSQYGVSFDPATGYGDLFISTDTFKSNFMLDYGYRYTPLNYFTPNYADWESNKFTNQTSWYGTWELISFLGDAPSAHFSSNGGMYYYASSTSAPGAIGTYPLPQNIGTTPLDDLPTYDQNAAGANLTTPRGDGIFDYGPNAQEPVYTDTGETISYNVIAAVDSGNVTYQTITVPIYQCPEPYQDMDNNDEWTDREPFEDYIVRYDWTANNFEGEWTAVDHSYMLNNYPGDVAGLWARHNNGAYDGPEPYSNVCNTKMQLTGMHPTLKTQIMYWDPYNWYEGGNAFSKVDNYQVWWQDTFGTAAPTYNLLCGGFVPTVAEYDITQTTRRLNTGYPTPGLFDDIGTIKEYENDELEAFPVYPDASGHVYDGPREFRDMPSSIYHRTGNFRLGEITYPGAQSTVEAIRGMDKGNGTDTGISPDSFIYWAGPLAYRVHGDHGLDAGDQLTLEALTWRTNGQSLTDTVVSNNLNRRGGWIGTSYTENMERSFDFTQGADYYQRICRDVNLDGLVDQGWAPDIGFENYIVDAEPATAVDNGAMTVYPFNRERLVEDVIENIDPSVDFSIYSNPNGATVAVTALWPIGYDNTFRLQPMSGLWYRYSGALSGPALLADGGVLTLDSQTPLNIEGQLMAMDAVEGPVDGSGASGSDPAQPGLYAMDVLAHEYAHDWGPLPDLYDYDKYNGFIMNFPVGGYDLMAEGGMTHLVPPNKYRTPTANYGWVGSGHWIEPRNLKGYLVPGEPQVLKIWPAEKNENQYYQYQRHDGLEDYFIWYESGDTIHKPKYKGIYILHSDYSHSTQGLPQQQRAGGHFTWEIVQADGLNHLQDGVNHMDSGDPFPGSTGRTVWNKNTNPSSRWWNDEDSGIEIQDIILPNNITDPAEITFLWKDLKIPELHFITPPGGESTSNEYKVRFETYSQFGQAAAYIFIDRDTQNFDGNAYSTNDVQFCILSSEPGGIGFSTPYSVATGGNFGNGTLEMMYVRTTTFTGGAYSTKLASKQTVTVTCTYGGSDGEAKFSVAGNVTGTEPLEAISGAPFYSKNNYSGFAFLIKAGNIDFSIGDSFTIETLGKVDYAQNPDTSMSFDLTDVKTKFGKPVFQVMLGEIDDPDYGFFITTEGTGIAISTDFYTNVINITSTVFLTTENPNMLDYRSVGGVLPSTVATHQQWTLSCVYPGGNFMNTGNSMAVFEVKGSHSGVDGFYTIDNSPYTTTSAGSGEFSFLLTGDTVYEYGDSFHFYTLGRITDNATVKIRDLEYEFREVEIDYYNYSNPVVQTTSAAYHVFNQGDSPNEFINQDLTQLDDGGYYYYAVVVPYTGGSEDAYSITPSALNVGNGYLTVNSLSISATRPVPTTCSSQQVWTMRCIYPGSNGEAKFEVTGSVTGYDGIATAAYRYTTVNDYTGMSFTIYAADKDFALNDRFVVKTMGLVHYTEPILVVNHQTVKRDNSSPALVITTNASVTYEGGSSVEFKVRLNSKPDNNVQVIIQSNDTTEGIVSGGEVLSFTNDNWLSFQTVTITGVDDTDVDGDQQFQVNFYVNSQSNDGYNGLSVAPLRFTNKDDEIYGLTSGRVSNNTDENGTTATFTVRLNSKPDYNVFVSVASSNTAEGTAAPSTLWFTPSNWRGLQTITVTGVNDSGEQDGTIAYSVLLQTTSDDFNFNGLFDKVDLSNIDNDVPSVIVGQITGDVHESGTRSTFKMRLSTMPSATVTVDLEVSDTTEGEVYPPHMYFTPSNWNTPQKVYVTGIDDEITDGDQVFSIITSTAYSSGDSSFDGLVVNDVTLRCIDNDTPGFLVTAPSGATSELGDTATFQVSLNNAPTAPVTINLYSVDHSEGKASPNTIVFTQTNWKSPQTITVTGQDDYLIDGDTPYTILLAPAISLDGAYNNKNPDDVELINRDDESAGVVVSEIKGVTSEDRESSYFTIVLTSKPASTVSFPISSSDTSEGVPLISQTTFTTTNWFNPQIIQVRGVDDNESDGDIAYQIIIGAATSSDPFYNQMNPPDVLVINMDNDTANIKVSEISGNTDESGGTATFTISLTTAPATGKTVTINMRSSDETEGKLSNNFVTFSDWNWQGVKTVTVTGQDDAIADDAVPYSIILERVAKTDLNDDRFEGIDPLDIHLYNRDNDSPGFNISKISGHTSELNATTATFTVALYQQPNDTVYFGLSSSDTSEGTVSPSSLLFTAANWNTPKTVTVTGVDDSIADGDIIYSIICSTAVSNDLNYNGYDVPDVEVINDDDDSAGFFISSNTADTHESNAASSAYSSFTVQPITTVAGTITLDVFSSDTSEGLVSTDATNFSASTVLIFTSSSPQTVYVQGVDDLVSDGNIYYAIYVDGNASTDASYSGIDPEDVWLFNIDDELPGLNTSVAISYTTESGESASIGIALKAEPHGDVSIIFESSDTTEFTITAGETLTFTQSSWDTYQTLTVKGVDDDLDDGDISTHVNYTMVSSDPGYHGLYGTLPVVNIDNDVAGIVLNTTTIKVDETDKETDSDLSSFTVALASRPYTQVRLSLQSSNESIAKMDKSSLTFSPGSWNNPQTVKVWGIDDKEVFPDTPFTITISTSQTDNTYYGVTPSTIAGTRRDDDKAGLILSTNAGVTDESGLDFTVNVRLNTTPSGTINLQVVSSDPSEGKVASSATAVHYTSMWLSFNASNWNTNQPINIQGQADPFPEGDGNVPYAILITSVSSSTSTDTVFKNLRQVSISVVNNNTDTPGMKITNAIDAETSEDGTSHTFYVSLKTKPVAYVTVRLSVASGVSEGKLNKTMLQFHGSNYYIQQSFTVTGLDDDYHDGTQKCTVSLTASSIDNAYNSLDTLYVEVDNIDNDLVGFDLSSTNESLHSSEDGKQAHFDIRLLSKPQPDTASVNVSIFSLDESEGILATPLLSINDNNQTVSTLTFTADTWNQYQRVYASGVDDGEVEEEVQKAYSVVIEVSATGDPDYAQLNQFQALINDDNDSYEIIITPTEDTKIIEGKPATSENGDKAVLMARLNCQPVGEVSLNISAPSSACTYLPSKLTFTPSNWSAPQYIIVTGKDNASLSNTNYSVSFTTSVSVTGSLDESYTFRNGSSVSMINLDNEQTYLALNVVDKYSSEDGGYANIEAVLTTTPVFTGTKKELAFLVNSLDTTEGLPVPAYNRLTFTENNWHIPRNILVKGVNDTTSLTDDAYQISVAYDSTGAFPSNLVKTIYSVDLINMDNNLPSLIVSNVEGVTYENDPAGNFQAKVNVELSVQPTTDVTIDVRTNNPWEGSILRPSSKTLTFTKDNWFQHQEIVLTGVDDLEDAQDGLFPYHLVIDPTKSKDSTFVYAETVYKTVYNADDDTEGFIITKSQDYLLENSTSPFTISVTPCTTPATNVVLPFSVNTESVVLSTSSLAFNAGDSRTKSFSVYSSSSKLTDTNLGSEAYAIYFSTPVGDDAYGSLVIPPLYSVLVDDETIRVNFDKTAMTVSEDGDSESFNVWLGLLGQSMGQPTEQVEVTLAVSDNTEAGFYYKGSNGSAVISYTTTLVFGPDTWQDPQLIVTTGINDNIRDDEQTLSIQVQSVISKDKRWNSLNGQTELLPSIQVTNLPETGYQILKINQLSETVLTGEGGYIKNPNNTDNYVWVLTTTPVDAAGYLYNINGTSTAYDSVTKTRPTLSGETVYFTTNMGSGVYSIKLSYKGDDGIEHEPDNPDNPVRIVENQGIIKLSTFVRPNPDRFIIQWYDVEMSEKGDRQYYMLYFKPSSQGSWRALFSSPQPSSKFDTTLASSSKTSRAKSDEYPDYRLHKYDFSFSADKSGKFMLISTNKAGNDPRENVSEFDDLTTTFYEATPPKDTKLSGAGSNPNFEGGGGGGCLLLP